MKADELVITWLDARTYTITCKDCYYQHRDPYVLPDESAFHVARRKLDEADSCHLCD